MEKLQQLAVVPDPIRRVLEAVSRGFQMDRSKDIGSWVATGGKAVMLKDYCNFLGEYV